MLDVARIVRCAALTGFRDYAVIYTWKTWLLGWYVRVFAQVSLFALIGRLLESEERTQFLVVGNAVLVAATGSLMGIAGITWERRAGTLPLLVASPSSPVVVFLGRGVWALTEGTISSLSAFFVAAPLFGVPLSWSAALAIVPVMVVVALSSYCLATFLAGLVLRAMALRNLAANLTQSTLLIVAGVNVPVAFYPATVEWLATVLPVTHGLQAVRGILRGAAATDVLADVALECAVALGWLAAALVTFNHLANRGRRDGTLEFSA